MKTLQLDPVEGSTEEYQKEETQPGDYRSTEHGADYSKELLDLYSQGATFLFSSPEKSILARGTAGIIEADSITSLPDSLKKYAQENSKAGLEMPIAVGAVPFDRNQPCRFVIPASVQWTGPQIRQTGKQETVFDGDVNIVPVPDPFEYATSVEKALEIMEEGKLKKIVLSRSIEVQSDSNINIQGLVRNLIKKNPTGYVFSMDLHQDSEEGNAGQRALVGASPELLVSKQGSKVVSNPLAGSIPRVADPKEDQYRAQQLLKSSKDLHEHSVVVDSVTKALKPFCKKLHVPKPSLISTQTMWHISTQIEGELKDPSTSSIELINAIHPTPAVCGYPRDLAYDHINQLEPFDRRFFTGAIGWCDMHGNGEWILALRCAELNDKKLTLFAGAGVVEGSSPLKETRETGAKFRTMLDALGVSASLKNVQLGGV
ncbi:MAG: isochorismate synthase DhbC [Lentisphaeraceae bacterium]|nr:isochorismate synthase DhbC [Lentisphaeraceae bacterium]